MSLARDMPPTGLHDRAADNLAYIRSAMERSGTFTGVSGRAFVVAGATALAAAYLAAAQATLQAWILVWAVELVLAAAVSVGGSAVKGQRVGTPLGSPPARRFVAALTPAMIAGGVLSGALLAAGAPELLPTAWLLLYGAAVLTAGLHSVPALPVMGVAFMVLGAAAAVLPGLGDVFLAVGFGGLHVLFGGILWRRHGG